MNIPILLITFNRPNHTRKVLYRIVGAKPNDLYVFRDYPRGLSPQPLSPVEKGEQQQHPDVEKCQQVIDVVKELTDGTGINVHYLLPETNLGCGAGPMTGISWFFDNVEQGIVMEDDCLAHPDFFPYCEELLNHYRGTEVKFINSTLYDDRWTKALNPIKEHSSPSSTYGTSSSSFADHQGVSYGYSHYMVTGAWASYREVWQGFDLDLKDMSALKFAWHVYRLTGNLAEAEWWWYQVRAIQQDKSKKSYWDYQMQIHLFRQNAQTIHPAVNLISNIGFDAEGTHTTANNGDGNRPTYAIFPLHHPVELTVDMNRDMRCWAKKQSKGLLKDLLYIIYHLYAWRRKFVR